MIHPIPNQPPIEEAEELLKKANVHLTAIRIAVWKEIMQLDHTFTLADMEDRMDTIDKSTLFRTLTLFLQRKLLHEVDNGSGSKLYCRCVCESGQHHSHIHFTCTECGQTFCIKNIDCSQIPCPKNFEVKEINCVMKGLCPECKIKKYSKDERNI